MTVTSLLELELRPGSADDALAVVRRTLEATRAFEGCLGVDVLVDAADPTHLVLLETWTSLEADDAYRAWRATPDGTSQLGTVLARPPVLTRFTTAPGV